VAEPLHCKYSFSPSLWCISHITIYICTTVSSTSTTCAHHSSSFSFLPTNYKCFWTCINCFHTTHCCFKTLSFAYVISVQINYTCECWI